VLGSQARLVIELAEGSLEVYGLLPLGNTHATPVMPPQPIVFQAPDGAKSLTVLEGSTPQASVSGNQVIVNGPFVSGETPLQIAYRIPYDGDTVTFAQALPLTLRQTTVVVRKLGNVRLEIPGLRSQREARFEGRTYIIGNADRIDANGQLSVRLRGLPHRSPWPRYVALLLALGITLAGVWIAIQPDRGAQDDTDARALRVRRATLFEQLVALERRLTDRPAPGTGQADVPKQDAAYAADLRARRDALVAEIEDLDDVLASVTSAARARAAKDRSGKVAADASKAAAFAESGAGPSDSRDARGASPGDAVEPRGEPRPAVR
jgi:cell division protein FtsB